MKIKVNSKNISNLVESISWSGDKDQLARKVSMVYAYPPKGSGIDRVSIKNGDILTIWDDDKTKRFAGIVVSVENDPATPDRTIKANDFAWYLLKNKTYKVYSGKPQDIARTVCKEFSITCGSFVKKSKTVSVTSTGDKTIYQVIQEAYINAGVSDISIFMDGKRLSIEIAGSKMVATLDGNDDVLGAKYATSIENMINKIVILDTARQYSSTVQKKDLVKKYGSMQETYKMEEGKDAGTEAEAMFKGIENSGSITVKDNMKCVAGKSIKIKKVDSNINGKFTIISDKHTYKNGTKATMELSLKFDEVMK